MVREMLMVLVLAVLLASTLPAGEIKTHHWPSTYVSQEIPGFQIPVVMDVGIVACRVLGTTVKLLQVGAGTFEGCGSVQVQCGHNVALSCSIVPTGVVQGTYSASLSPSDVDAPGGISQLCVGLTDARPGGQAGRRNVRVAVVRITVTSR